MFVWNYFVTKQLNLDIRETSLKWYYLELLNLTSTHPEQARIKPDKHGNHKNERVDIWGLTTGKKNGRKFRNSRSQEPRTSSDP